MRSRVGRLLMAVGAISCVLGCAATNSSTATARRGIQTDRWDWRPVQRSMGAEVRDPLPTLAEVAAWFAGATGRTVLLGRTKEGHWLGEESPPRRVGAVTCVDVPWKEALELVVATAGCRVRDDHGTWVIYEPNPPEGPPGLKSDVGTYDPDDRPLTQVVEMLQEHFGVRIDLGTTADGKPLKDVWPPYTVTISWAHLKSLPVAEAVQLAAKSSACTATWDGERWLITQPPR